MSTYTKYTLLLILVISLAFSIGELFLRTQKSTPKMIKLSVTPRRLFSPDPVTGWRPGPGVYSIYVNDPTIKFTASIDSQGNRNTCAANEAYRYDKNPRVHLYGCSCTFGFSVADSNTQAYRLQKLLPGLHVKNLGVPGYGLTQMYLKMQQSLAAGDTPYIAVFNYADFHDFRVPLSKTWSSMISYCVAMGDTSNFGNLALPYYSFESGVPILHRVPLDSLSHFWLFADQSSLIFLANLLYDFKLDDVQKDKYHSMAHNTALEMMSFCKRNHVIPIFAELVNSNEHIPSTDIREDLAAKGYLTLNYGIDFGEGRYNCGPFDMAHPNTEAHRIFADKLYQLIIKNKLDSLSLAQE